MTPIGVDLVTCPNSDVGEILPLGEPVDLVVEEQDLDVHVAAEHMDHVVAADAQAVAVAGGDPDVKLRVGEFDAGGDGRCAAVNAVEAVDVHVVREAAGTADTRNGDVVLFRMRELREHALDLGEDGIVAASRAPADVLVGLKILCRQFCGAATVVSGIVVSSENFLNPALDLFSTQRQSLDHVEARGRDQILGAEELDRAGRC